MCNSHYLRMRRYGDVRAGKAIRGEAMTHLLATYTLPDAHDPGWPYDLTAFGYGRIWKDGRMWHAHQISCELAHGPKPSRLHEVRHSCRVRSCYFAEHLSWGTPKENSGDDKRRDGTTGKGESNSMAKLSETAVGMIRVLVDSRQFSQLDIAELFNITPSNVSAITRDRSWGK
jgi:predicted XRE-type DNA-binding protein